MSCSSSMQSAVIFVTNASIVYLMWIALHYAAVYFYHEYCVPTTWTGLLLSPFMAIAPHCKAFRWIISTGGSTIETMWVVLGLWSVKQVVIPSKVAHTTM